MSIKKTSSEIKLIAEEIGIKNKAKLVTKQFQNIKQKVAYICERGHSIERSLEKFRFGSGVFCNQCRLEIQKEPVVIDLKKSDVPLWHWNINEQKKLGLKTFEKLVNKKDGRLINKNFIKANGKLEVDCGKGHTWSINLNNVRTGYWCPYCSGLKLWDMTLEQKCQNHANSKKGKFLSIGKIRARDDVLWKCECGYEWSARVQHVLEGSWCPKCAGKAPITLEELKEIAQARGGNCLKIIKNKNKKNRIRGIFQCSEGHIWEANIHNVKHKGRWCNDCSSSIAERICREVFETLFEKKFPKTRPDFLKNPDSGINLELDGFNAELKMAFEYQGHFHYKDSAKLTSKSWVNAQIKRDKFKLQQCQVEKIILLTIPEIKNINHNQIIDLILEILEKNKIKYKKTNIKKVDINKAYLKTPRKDLVDLLEINGHTLKEELWKGAQHNYEIICDKGHEYKRTIHKLSSTNPKKWCIICNNSTRFNVRYTIEDVKKSLIGTDITLITSTFVGVRKSLKLRCSKGHLFSKSYKSILKNILDNKEICTFCNGRKVDLNFIKKIATACEGKCLSKQNVNASTKINFECGRGHRFSINLNNIITKNRWCKYCYKIDKERPPGLLKLLSK